MISLELIIIIFFCLVLHLSVSFGLPYYRFPFIPTLSLYFQWQNFITFKSRFTSSHLILDLLFCLKAMVFYSEIFLVSRCSSILFEFLNHAILLDLTSLTKITFTAICIPLHH